VSDLDQELRSATARRDLVAEEAQASKSRVAELEAVAAGLRAELEMRAHTNQNDGTQSRLELLERRLDDAHQQFAALQSTGEALADVERRLAAALSEQAATAGKMRLLERELAERTRAYVEVADELARVHGGEAPQQDVQPRHLVFVTMGASYEIVELDGLPPAPGEVVELESGRHVVVRVGGSPLAGSRLPCAYTIPA
jgi:cell pole-organizing protein PopZ